MSKIEISEEERKNRSERMKQLHAEGRAGAEFGKLGGRPRKRTATSIAAEKIAEKGEMIAKKLISLIEDSESEKVSLDAIKHAHTIEESERKALREEEVDYNQLKHADLSELVIGNLFELIRSGRIDFAEIEDAEIVEQRQIGPASQID